MERAAECIECRGAGGIHLIKLDRLAHDAHFLLCHKKAGVEFVAADMPDANKLMVGVMAPVAEEEARATSVRTRPRLLLRRRGGQTGKPTAATGFCRDDLQGARPLVGRCRAARN